MFATFGSAITGEVGPTFGPMPHAQVTYGTLRAGDPVGDAYTIAVYSPDGLWRIVTPERNVHAYMDGERIDADPSRWAAVVGSEWTDITMHETLEG